MMSGIRRGFNLKQSFSEQLLMVSVPLNGNVLPFVPPLSPLSEECSDKYQWRGQVLFLFLQGEKILNEPVDCACFRYRVTTKKELFWLIAHFMGG